MPQGISPNDGPQVRDPRRRRPKGRAAMQIARTLAKSPDTDCKQAKKAMEDLCCGRFYNHALAATAKDLTLAQAFDLIERCYLANEQAVPTTWTGDRNALDWLRTHILGPQ